MELLYADDLVLMAEETGKVEEVEERDGSRGLGVSASEKEGVG